MNISDEYNRAAVLLPEGKSEEAAGYNPFFNPIRTGMYCGECNHMFALHFPEKL